ELRKGGPEGQARDGGLQLAVDGAGAFRGRHLGVEELDVRRAALQEQQDDGLILDELVGRGGPGAGGEQSGKTESGETQRADGEERATAVTLAGVVEAGVA